MCFPPLFFTPASIFYFFAGSGVFHALLSHPLLFPSNLPLYLLVFFRLPPFTSNPGSHCGHPHPPPHCGACLFFCLFREESLSIFFPRQPASSASDPTVAVSWHCMSFNRNMACPPSPPPSARLSRNGCVVTDQMTVASNE